MNLNHDPDKHLLDQIDRRLETGQPSGNALLDELATARPIPRPAAQNALEEQLLARLKSLNQGETSMASRTSYMPIDAPRRNWLPLTLIAALIVAAIAGLMLINGIGKSPKINEMALAAPSLTPTPTGSIVPPVMYQNLRIPGVGNVEPVVIALRDIPRGTVLSSRWLSVAYWQVDDSNQTYTDPEILRGLVANQDIPRWQPIIPAYLTDQPVSTSQSTDVPSPNVNVVVAFQNLPRGYTFSDRDLSNAAGYSGWPADKVPEGAIRDNNQSSIMMLPGKTLQTAVSRGQPILISDLSGGTNQTLVAPTSPAVHNTSVVQIRLSSLTDDSLLPGVGGSVDVIALLPFKADSSIGDIPSTPMPDGTRLVETYVLRNTFVFYHSDRSQSDGFVAISVSANDNRLLTWLAEQPNVMFRLQKPLNNVFDIPDKNTIVSIPFENVTASENIQPGDRVNVISTCAFVPDVMGMNNTVISSKTDCNQSVEETRAINVQVFIGEIVVNGRQPAVTYDSIALVIPKDAVTLFNKLNDAQMHFKLVKSLAAIQPTPTQTPISSPTTNSTTTPTPAPTVRIVVAYQNLPRGFGFPNNKVDMQTAAYYAAWTADSVPFDALREDANGLEQLQGKILRTDIYSQQPITLSNLEEAHSSASTLNAINILPSDRVPVELSRAQITNDGIEPVRGDWVNIVALIPLDENTATENLQVTHTPDGKRLIASRVAFGALVAVMGSWPQPQIDATNTPPDPSKITFGVAPDQAGLLTWLATQGITFKLELVKSADVLVPTPALQPPIPKGRVTVDIPLASLTTKEQSEKLQVGDYVDVIATVLTIDSELPSAFQGPATLQPGQTPGQRTERIVSEALIVKTDDVITLAVSPDAASLLQQWITAKIPMTLRPVDPASATNESTNSLTLQLPLDSASRWAADELQVGDKVDVIMGFVTGSSDAVNLAFKYYGALNWLDGLSKEKVFARIYAPNNGKPGRDGIFMHRIIQNAEVIAINTYTDTKSGRMSTLNITVELPTSITLTDLSTINDYVQAGMPYLVIKQ